jgi:LppP/LprE lipoprotein
VSLRRLPTLLVLCPVLALAACGGSKQASVVTRTRTVVRTVTAPATTATGPTTTATSTTATPSGPLTLRAAEQLLAARGYAVLTERDWHPDQTLKVLIGIRSAPPRAELAFLFAGNRFIGTDTRDPSGAIEVVAQGDRSVTLGYGIYRPGDALCCASGGTAQVTYAWNGTRLTPLQPIPPADPGAARSRR